MRRSALLLVAVVVLSGLSGIAVAEEARTLKGSFVWNNNNHTGDLEARFTSTGVDTWNVSFHFQWEGEPRVFSGTAEGSLSGALQGKVTAGSSDKGTFTFAGSFADGTFQGTHGYIDEDGKSEDTGTLTLKG